MPITGRMSTTTRAWSSRSGRPGPEGRRMTWGPGRSAGEWVQEKGLTTLGDLRELRSANGHDRRQQGELDVGVGYAPAHHGELLQGMFDDGTGGLRRALVTLPQPGRGSRAV